MKKSLLSILLLPLIVLVGCTQNTKTMPTTNEQPTDLGTSGGDMMDHAAMGHTIPGSDNAMDHTVTSEVNFIVNMIPHHQEAVDSSIVLLSKTTNPELIQLAQSIINAQTKEIALMQGRLTAWYPDTTEVSTYMNMMPNMTDSTGSVAERAYLQGMIAHHEGAVQMAMSIMQLPHRAEVMDLANNIISTQNKEIATMKQILERIQ